MEEFVESLRLPEHFHVFAVAVGDAAEEGVHVEVVDQTRFAVVAGRWVEGFAVGVEERGEAAHERGADLVGVEGDRADEADALETAVVGDCAAACHRILVLGGEMIDGLQN